MTTSTLTAYTKYAVLDPCLRLGVSVAAGDLVYVFSKSWPSALPTEKMYVKNVTDGLMTQLNVYRVSPFIGYFKVTWPAGTKNVEIICPSSGYKQSVTIVVTSSVLRDINVLGVDELISGDGEALTINSETANVLIIPSRDSTNTLYTMPTQSVDDQALSYIGKFPAASDMDVLIQNFGPSEVVRVRVLDGARDYAITFGKLQNGTLVFFSNAVLPSTIKYSITGDLAVDWTSVSVVSDSSMSVPSGKYGYKITGLPNSTGTYDVYFRIMVGNLVSNSIKLTMVNETVYELKANGVVNYTAADGNANLTISNVKYGDTVELRYDSPLTTRAYYEATPESLSPYTIMMSLGDGVGTATVYTVTARVNGVETNSITILIPAYTQVLRMTANGLTNPCVDIGVDVTLSITGHKVGDTLLINTGFCTRYVTATAVPTTYKIKYPSAGTYIANVINGSVKSNDVMLLVGC